MCMIVKDIHEKWNIPKDCWHWMFYDEEAKCDLDRSCTKKCGLVKEKIKLLQEK